MKNHHFITTATVAAVFLSARRSLSRINKSRDTGVMDSPGAAFVYPGLKP